MLKCLLIINEIERENRMKSMKKKVISGILAGMLLIPGFAGMHNAEAVPADEQMERSVRPPLPPKLSEREKNEIAKEVVSQYDVDEGEVRSALEERRPLDDIYYAGMLAKASGRSFREVISMKADWWEVERRLGVTEEQIATVISDMVARDVAMRSELDEAVVKRLLDAHYRPRDIRIAGRIAKAAKKDVQSVLDMKKINQRWRDVARELGVSLDVLRPRNSTDEQEDAEAAQAEVGAAAK